MTCITFNYDDFFDHALYDYFNEGVGHWHPNAGYGFICSASASSIPIASDSTIMMQGSEQSSMNLLKLHGSINWYAQLGATVPYKVNDIVHHSRWYLSGKRGRNDDFRKQFGLLNRLPHISQIERNLEPAPFIVPPVLTKSDLTGQPILRLLWKRAYDVLSQAKRVIFVGYSLPITDIAASYLFDEAIRQLPGLPQIQVVDYAPKQDDLQKEAEAERKRQNLVLAYRKVFPELNRNRFLFNGAKCWASDFCSEHADD